jgi:hypothetical protein
MPPEAKERISAVQQARWAKQKRGSIKLGQKMGQGLIQLLPFPFRSLENLSFQDSLETSEPDPGPATGQPQSIRHVEPPFYVWR